MQVETINNYVAAAETCIAQKRKVDSQAKLYDWYLDLVFRGAELHGLPKAYIDSYEQCMRSPIDGRPELHKGLDWSLDAQLGVG